MLCHRLRTFCAGMGHDGNRMSEQRHRSQFNAWAIMGMNILIVGNLSALEPYVLETWTNTCVCRTYPMAHLCVTPPTHTHTHTATARRDPALPSRVPSGTPHSEKQTQQPTPIPFSPFSLFLFFSSLALPSAATRFLSLAHPRSRPRRRHMLGINQDIAGKPAVPIPSAAVAQLHDATGGYAQAHVAECDNFDIILIPFLT